MVWNYMSLKLEKVLNVSPRGPASPFVVMPFYPCSIFLYCEAFSIILLPLINHLISSIALLCSCNAVAITVSRSSLWWGPESDLYVMRRDHFHSNRYLLRALSCSPTFALRPQRHQHNEKWCLSPNISCVSGGLDEAESQRTSMTVSWKHFRFIFKESENWCFHCGATRWQYDGVWCIDMLRDMKITILALAFSNVYTQTALESTKYLHALSVLYAYVLGLPTRSHITLLLWVICKIPVTLSPDSNWTFWSVLIGPWCLWWLLSFFIFITDISSLSWNSDEEF